MVYSSPGLLKPLGIAQAIVPRSPPLGLVVARQGTSDSVAANGGSFLDQLLRPPADALLDVTCSVAVPLQHCELSRLTLSV